MNVVKGTALFFWLATLLWGIASLLLYRSDAQHGPDIVGEEVAHFLIPIVVSLLMAMGMVFLPGESPLPFECPKFLPLVISFTAGGVSVGVYLSFIMR